MSESMQELQSSEVDRRVAQITALYQIIEEKNAKIKRLYSMLRGDVHRIRMDSARMDWLADNPPFEAFGIDDVDQFSGCANMDIYEFAAMVADERGNDGDPTVSDQREGFRRMIDAAMGVQP